MDHHWAHLLEHVVGRLAPWEIHGQNIRLEMVLLTVSILVYLVKTVSMYIYPRLMFVVLVINAQQYSLILIMDIPIAVLEHVSMEVYIKLAALDQI